VHTDIDAVPYFTVAFGVSGQGAGSGVRPGSVALGNCQPWSAHPSVCIRCKCGISSALLQQASRRRPTNTRGSCCCRHGSYCRATPQVRCPSLHAHPCSYSAHPCIFQLDQYGLNPYATETKNVAGLVDLLSYPLLPFVTFFLLSLVSCICLPGDRATLYQLVWFPKKI
jgi:hypothetical protein